MTDIEKKQIFGRDLRVGDTIEVWWSLRQDTITSIKKYDGPLAYLWKDGAIILSFLTLKTGMTAGNSDIFVCIGQSHYATELRDLEVANEELRKKIANLESRLECFEK